MGALSVRQRNGLLSNILESPLTASWDDDAILIRRFVAGDEDAFASLYRRYADKVFAIAKGILLANEEAADAVQEVFTLVYRNIDKFDQRSRFSTWLFRVAVNRSIQEVRKTKRHKHAELLEDSATVQIPEGQEDPKVQTALAKLSPSDRAVLVLFYWEDLSLIEIADSMSCAPNAAKTRLHRARERFRVAYEGSE